MLKTPRGHVHAFAGGWRAAALALALAWPAQAAHAQAEESGAAESGRPLPAAAPDAGLPEVVPPIGDEEFESLVPEFRESLDPELDRPLESIEEFERRLSGTEAGAEAAAAPLGDPELLAPLPPLGEFEFEQLEAAAPGPDEPGAVLRYRTELAGLETADEATPDNLRGRFDELSKLRAGDGEAANIAQIRARLIEDAEVLRTILASQGWFDPAIATRIETPGGDGGDAIVAVIEVEPGQRFRFGSIEVQAEETVPPGMILDSLALAAGEPIVAERILAGEARAVVDLSEHGYPFAEIGQRDILLDRETGLGDYTLPVDTGPRARFGGFRTEGELAFGADHIARIARFEQGDLFDNRMLDDLRQALLGTGLFSSVSAVPERTGQDAGDGTEYVTVSVEQHAGPPRTIAAQAGYATGEGFRVEGSWTHRNLFPPEGALIVSGLAGTKEQSLGLTFRRSNAGRRDRTFQLTAELLHSDYAAVEGYTARLAGQVSYGSTPIWHKRLTYAYGGQLLATSEAVYDAALGERRRRTFYVAGLNGQVGFDTTDDLLDPARGFRIAALVEPEAVVDGEFQPYVRAQIDASAYVAAGDSLVIAGRARLGSIQGAGLFELAPSRRFYAGGGGSVRGFAYQGLGPLAPDGKPAGGRSLNEAALEVRYRFGDYGLAAFADVGQAYEETLPQFNALRVGVGLGARYYTRFGPLRIDVATPLDRRPGESRISVYISIGQAF